VEKQKFVTAVPGLTGRSVFAAVRAGLPSLQPGEASVARLFLEQPQAVIHLTVSQAAQTAGVSTATVVRCAQSLGFKGFHEIKLMLAQEVAASDSGRLADVEPGDPPIEILHKVAQAGAQAIMDAITTVSAESVDAVVRVLAAARSVLFLGVGTSAPLASDAAYRFKTIGLRAEFPPDAHVQHVTARLLSPDDVCFAISHTGSTSETLVALRAAKAAGATTVAVTSFASSPVTELVDHVIVAGAREVAFHLEAVGSRLAHFAVLDALLVAVGLRDRGRATAAMNLYTDSLSDHRL
jgi:DNA-binding MurR/RpiR family transcriptional regulator